MNELGLHPHPVLIRVVQPIGISFFLFFAISYLVDVYQRKMPAENNLGNFALSLAFFPIMLAGPVHRPAWLLPQIRRIREFDF
jgi:D-alanyl-lipoteichoic acid acyltransferase DltB (MBOAT superfamily)